MIGIIRILILFQVVLSISFAETIPKPDSESLSQKDWLLWGTYKPNLISAITQHSTTPITVGLAYSSNFGAKPSFETFKNSLKLRMNKDSKAHYLYHNGFDFARQKIEDKSLGLTYSIDFLKNQTSSQSWSYLINSEKASSGSSFDPRRQQSSSTYVYIALENQKNPENRIIKPLKYINQESYQSILLNVWDPISEKSQGYFRVTVFEGDAAKWRSPKPQEAFHCLVHSSEDEIEEKIYGQLEIDILKGFVHFDPKRCHENNDANFFMLQVVTDQNVKIMVSFSSEEIPDLHNHATMSEALGAQEQKFNQHLDSNFGVENLNKYRFDIGEIKTIQRLAVSNIMGRIASSYESNILHLKPLPSRIVSSHQPFLGEGYSQELVCQWNSSLCFKMVNAWTDILPLLECSLLKNDDSHRHPKSDLLTSMSYFRPIFHFLKLAKKDQTNHEIISFLLKAKTILKNFLLNLQIQSDKSYICKLPGSEIVPEEFSLWVLYLTQGALAIEQLIEQDASQELSSLQKVLLNSLPSQNYFNLHPFIFDDGFDSFELIENILTQYGVRESNDNSLSPISVPFNYMLLANLHKQDKNPHLYKAIRENLIKLISSNWRAENNLWNSYDSFTGIGKGLPDFSGATSLIALIYSEIY